MEREFRVGDWVTSTEERELLVKLFAFGDEKSELTYDKEVMQIVETKYKPISHPDKVGILISMRREDHTGELLLLKKRNNSLGTQPAYYLRHATEEEIKREQLKRLFPN